MNIELVNEIKPLVANLLRIDFIRYLKTKDFYHTLLEYNFDQLWKSANEHIRAINPYVGITGDPSVGYMDAFQFTLNLYYPLERSKFFKFIKVILIDFIRWDTTKTDLAKIQSNLRALDMSDVDLKEIKDAQITKSAENIIHNKNPKILKSNEVLKTSSEIDPKLCFVLMPFKDEFTSIYKSIINPIVTSLNLKCLRADEIFTSTKIVEDIFKNIKKSNLLIADLTGKNPNVFYELGISHSLNKEVILLTQEISDVPFDISHYRIIIYQDTISGAEKLKHDLTNYIQEYLKSKGS